MTGVGASYAPRTAILTWPSTALQPAPAASQRPVPKPCAHNPPAGAWMTRCQREVHAIHPSGLPLACGSQVERELLGVRRASDPAVTSDARRGGDRPLSPSPNTHNLE